MGDPATIPEKIADILSQGRLTRIEKLREMVKLQSSSGNYDYDHYMHGMANGMIFALSCVEGSKPVFLDPPDKWLHETRVVKLTTQR